MSFLYAIVLGLVQGLTEFLPVSSSGHLVLLNMLFGGGGNFLFLSILLHVATLFAVLLVFRKEIWDIFKNPWGKYAKRIYISFIPTAVLAFLFKGVFDDAFAGSFLPVCFLLTALFLLVCDFFAKERNQKDVSGGGTVISKKNAFLMGVAQGIAVFPGISRSGATICTGLIAGENRNAVAKFSFIMSIPVILASMLYEVLFNGQNSFVSTSDILPTLVAFLTAFVVGVFAIKFMLKVVSKARYFWFSIYLFALGTLTVFLIY